jgi:hypothetical protein
MVSHDITQSFNYSSASFQIFSVPLHVNQLFVVLFGAAGGLTNTGLNTPGLGAKISSTHNVVPGSTLYLYLGGKGATSTGTNSISAGGWNGGGNGYTGSGGGGATDIRTSTALGDRMIVAAGGGGTYSNTCPSRNGGNGGTPNGQPGPVGSNSGCGGTAGSGGTQSTFGTNTYSLTLSGEIGQGGSLASSSQTSGGGGGYYGKINCYFSYLRLFC